MLPAPEPLPRGLGAAAGAQGLLCALRGTLAADSPPGRALPASSSSSSAYRLNSRVFWPLVAFGGAALLCLLQRKAVGAAAGSAPPSSPSVLKASLLVLLLLLLLLLGFVGLRLRRRAQDRGSPPGRQPPSLRRLLEAFYAEELRVSPHVLGHSKAHVRHVVGEVARAGKAGGRRLAFRGDFVPVGSADEQHKTRRRPDAAFRALLPLRLPPGLQLQVRPLRGEDRPPGLRGSFLCALHVRHPGGDLGPLCLEEEEEEGAGAGAGLRLSSALVLRWFQGRVQRCLGAVRLGLEERCRVRLLPVGAGRPPSLGLAPRSDYLCCGLSLSVGLLPALPLGQGLYLTPSSGSPSCALWTLDVSRPEQRFWGWARQRLPEGACHLRCLQLLEGLRDAAWGCCGPEGRRVLSSAVLKTALFWLLLRGPWREWRERCLAERLAELVAFVAGALRTRRLRHFFLGNAALPEALALPRSLRQAAPVNLLEDFDADTLDGAAAQLCQTWRQAPALLARRKGPP